MAKNENKKESFDLSGEIKSYNNDSKFQDDLYNSAKALDPGTPKIIKLVIKYSGGLVKNEKQANYILIGFAIVVIVISSILIFKNFSSGYNYKEKMINPGRVPSVN